MPAGGSAAREADESRRHAVVLAHAASEQARRAARFSRGGLAEAETAGHLAALSPYDFCFLHDRRWPGTARCNIDHVVAGPSGVFVIDTKDWSGDLHIEAGRMFRGESECDDDVDKVRAQADAVREVLADVGLPAIQVRGVIALHGRAFDLQSVAGTWVVDSARLPSRILRHSKALTPAQVEQVVSALVVALPPADSRSASPSRGSPPCEPEPELGDAGVEPPEGLFSAADLEEAALAAAMQRPFADWMTFLHPAQARFVRRDFAGPARITGGAGTGKTVVALHRLAYLSQGRARRLMYVTFVKTVPRVLAHAFARLAPDTADRVEFASLHAWAMRFLRARRIPCSVDNDACDRAYARAWAHLEQRAMLERSAPYSYWREEVHTVIRGRDLRDLDEYLVLDRVGRGSRLGHVQRRAVWKLATSYAQHLRQRHLRDWSDVLRLARDEARRLPPQPAYDAVVLDEAQDMPLLAGQLLVALAGDRPNGLLFVGDDEQRVFPGGFRLSECGVDVTGRSVRFTDNYRNTSEVYEAAAALLTGEGSGVLDDPGIPCRTSASRRGTPPQVIRAGSAWEHDVALVASLTEWLATRRPSHTVAVLVERIASVRHLVTHLRDHGIPAVELEDWDGASSDAVIVGTPKRAKGLEFTRVHVGYVEPQVLAAAPRETTDACLEQWQLRRREMYVAMTRARDELWVGVVDPSVSSAQPARAEGAADVAAPAVTSVAGVMAAVLGDAPTGGPARFGEPGWTYEGVLAPLTCETCGSAMHVCRKPYESAGRIYRYWAVTCAQCLTSRAPDQLTGELAKVLRRLA
jgi:Nuclease-related domain/AAA domain